MRTPDRALGWLLGSLLAMSLAFLMCSCALGSTKQRKPDEKERSTIVAGAGEKTFSDKYHLSITLPMSEKEFLALLGRLNLHYDSCGERGMAAGVPPARHATSIDLSEAQKCYEIAGERTSSFDEWYRAFVNKDHNVIYIENAFAYTGP